MENEEVGIISGALDMKTKTVKDVMKKLEEVFMLSSDAILNFDTMAEIEYHGMSHVVTSTWPMQSNYRLWTSLCF